MRTGHPFASRYQAGESVLTDPVKHTAFCAISRTASTGSGRYCGIRTMPSCRRWSEPGRHSQPSCWWLSRGSRQGSSHLTGCLLHSPYSNSASDGRRICCTCPSGIGWNCCSRWLKMVRSVLLGRARMNNSCGISRCSEALGTLRALDYDTSNWIVSSSQARTHCGRMTSFGSCSTAPSRLGDLCRTRTSLTREKTTVVNRLQKTLETSGRRDRHSGRVWTGHAQTDHCGPTGF